MEKELIDPMNEDTYDDRVIVHSNIIKTMVQSKKYGTAWDRIFSLTLKNKRKNLKQNVRSFVAELKKYFMVLKEL